MTATERTFKAMQQDCIRYGRANEPVWITNPIIKALFESLEANDRQLEAAIVLQDESDATGHTAEKNTRIEALAKQCYKTSRKLTLYAKQKNNQVLLNDVDISESALQRASDDELFLICSRIVKRGREYLRAMVAYGLTADELDAIEAQVTSIKALPTNITMATSEHKTATRTIKQTNADARVILDQLDDAYEGLVDDKTFTDGWFDIRKIKGRHHTKKTN